MNEPKRLREFPEWPVEQVMEVMRVLYSLAPIKRDLWNDKSRWTSLARQACDFLDHSHSAAEEVARQRSATHDAYRQGEARSAKAETLPQVVPFAKAVRTITHEKNTKRAEEKLETLFLKNPRYFGGLFGNPPTKRTVSAQIKKWRETGIPRDEVMELQKRFEDSWPRIKSEQNADNAKKREKRGARVPTL